MKYFNLKWKKFYQYPKTWVLVDCILQKSYIIQTNDLMSPYTFLAIDIHSGKRKEFMYLRDAKRFIEQNRKDIISDWESTEIKNGVLIERK